MTHNRCQSVGVSIGVLFFLTVCLVMLPALARAGACETWAAKAVSVQGIVQARLAGATQWVSISLDDSFCPGDRVRVKANARASLVLSNDTILRLDQNTTVTFSVIAQDEPSQLDVLDGIAHFISRVRQSFKVITPFVNAAVEGTEFVVAVRADESRITVFEGRVLARNPQGQIRLNSGQSAVARVGQAPVMRALVRPRDAVQWALYYPPILDYDPEQFLGVPAPWQSSLQDSIAAYRRGDAAAALNRIAGLPDNLRNARVYTYRASLRLAVGRVEEAKTDLGRALALNPKQSDALALSAMIAVVQNDRSKARSLAEQAVTADPGSATAKLALSYVQQADFDIEGALATVRQAIDYQADNALAWARLAELRLSLGELKQALLIARRATEINPELARTQSVLGFAYLTQIKVKKAKQAFQRAIELDQSDPLSRLGLGLAIIRQGELEEGRRQIELAASLDPNNSLIRSYLGKAYYEEKRDKIAASEFNIAKDLDANDPTPWFYNAIREQTVNRPVEALHDLQKSIELNDNRAVYRSRLLLDGDLAARSASLARIYRDLDFRQVALVEGGKSVNIDPSNHSAHRFLADSYVALPRHESARVSELLQAQLLQPINLNPLQPQLAETDLAILEGTGPSDLSFNEFNPLFVRNRFAVQANAILGSNDTRGDDVVLSGLHGPVSFSLGKFEFDTDGYRENNDLKHNIYNAFVQVALSPKSNFQIEWRDRNTEHGDIASKFDLTVFSTQERRKIESNSLRFGYRYTAAPGSDVLVSLVERDQTDQLNVNTVDVGGNGQIVDTVGDDLGRTIELQYLLSKDLFNTVIGLGRYRQVGDNVIDVRVFAGGVLVFQQPLLTNTDIDHDNAYIYSTLMPTANTAWTLGLSYDNYEGSGKDKRELNPKFGLIWDVTESTTLRLAAFEVLKRSILSDQTIEPVQVAGFNQFFDEPNGSESKRYGIGLDQQFTRNLYVGIELSRRDADVIKRNKPDQQRKEQLHRAYLYWTPTAKLALSAEYHFDYVDADLVVAADPIELKTQLVPLRVGYFFSAGLFTRLTATRVQQDVEFASSEDDEKFWVADAEIGYRFPKRLGTLSVLVKNINDEDFKYQDQNYLTTERSTPMFIPERTAFIKLTLAF